MEEEVVSERIFKDSEFETVRFQCDRCYDPIHGLDVNLEICKEPSTWESLSFYFWVVFEDKGLRKRLNYIWHAIKGKDLYKADFNLQYKDVPNLIILLEKYYDYCIVKSSKESNKISA